MHDIVFLGIFDKIANWIMSGITSVLTWLVSNVIAPVCSVIWENAVKYIVEFVAEILATFVYKLYAFALSVLYAIETAVYAFSGATNVNYQGKQDNIVSIIFQQPAVEKAFWYITALSVVLLFIFTTISVIRNTLDFGYDGKRNVGTILTRFITSAITFLILPALCYGLIDLTSRVMNSLYVATSMGSVSSITDNLFLLSVRSSVENASLEFPISQAEYNSLVGKIQETNMFWYNLSDVLPYIHRASNVDFVVGIIGLLILLINLITMAGTFIQRVIEIIVLYIVSPLFVATIPLDDGERFGRWRRTFIGRLCMGVGMIVTLNIVMMVLCIVISGTDGYTISFTEEISASSNVVQAAANKSVDIILKLVFMIGCLLAVKNLGTTITGIIDQDAGMAERASINENSRRLRQMPHAARHAIGTAKFAAGYLSDSMKKSRQNSMVKGSVSRGFSGEVASSKEQSFADTLKRRNSVNAAKADFTKRGSKYSALKGQIEKGNKALSDFTKLKTHAEREKFMAKFNKQGGVASLKVDGSKFADSDMTSSSERKALRNLDTRIANTKQLRDTFAKGSKDWNKYNTRLSNLSRLRNQFDMLDKHSQRADFIKSHSEFGDIEGHNRGEAAVARKLANRVEEAKAARDKLAPNSPEWNRANKAYQALLQKQAMFSGLTSHSERSSFTRDNIEARAEDRTSKERRALSAISDRKRRAIANRNMFEKGSAGWNQFNEEIQRLDNLVDEFNSRDTRAEREKLMESHADFTSPSSMGFTDSRRMKNITGNIARIQSVRSKYSPNSPEYKALDSQLSSLISLRSKYENATSDSERAEIHSLNGDMFEDNVSKGEVKALGNLNARMLTIRNNRDMFKQGSDEWNTYDARLTQLESLGTQMQLIGSKTDREAFIAGHEAEFSDYNSSEESKDSARKALSTNLDRAIQNRDRHRAGSTKWQQCNSEVRELALARAKYDSMPDSESRQSFVRDNSSMFTDVMSEDSGYKSIEQAYSAWNILAHYAPDSETREHAHKMAKSYAAYSEQYQRATGEDRSAVLQKIANFESSSVSVEGVQLTPKEYEGFSMVADTGNERAIRDYANAVTHQERSNILKAAKEGKFERFEFSNSTEEDYGAQLTTASDTYGKMASQQADPQLKEKYEAMQSFYKEAGTRYMTLATHSQREAFAEYVSAEVVKQSGGGALAGMPAYTPPEISEKEESFASGLDAQERLKFAALPTHRARYKYMDEYYQSSPVLELSSDEGITYDTYFSGSSDTEYEGTAPYRTAYLAAKSHDERNQIMRDYETYVNSAPEAQQPGNWGRINTEGLSDIFVSKQQAAAPKPDAVQPDAEAAASLEARADRADALEKIMGDAMTRRRSNSAPPHRSSSKESFMDRKTDSRQGGNE